MWTNAQKRSRRKRIKPRTVVSSGGLGEVDKRKKLLLLSIYWVVLGCFTKRIYLLLRRVENKKTGDNRKICGCQGLVGGKTE